MAQGVGKRGPYGLHRSEPKEGIKRDIPDLADHFGSHPPQGYPEVGVSLVRRHKDRRHSKVYRVRSGDTGAPIVKPFGYDPRFDLDRIPEHTSGGPVTRGPWDPATTVGPCIMREAT